MKNHPFWWSNTFDTNKRALLCACWWNVDVDVVTSTEPRKGTCLWVPQTTAAALTKHCGMKYLAGGELLQVNRKCGGKRMVNQCLWWKIVVQTKAYVCLGIQIPITRICSILELNLPMGVGLEGSSKNVQFSTRRVEFWVTNMNHKYWLSRMVSMNSY